MWSTGNSESCAVRYTEERGELFRFVLGLGEVAVSLKVLLGRGEHHMEIGKAVLKFMYATGLSNRV